MRHTLTIYPPHMHRPRRQQQWRTTLFSAHDTTMLPTQESPRASLTPEQRLVLAVLERGLADFLFYARSTEPENRRRAKYAWHQRRRFEQCNEWLRSDAANYPFTFRSCCDVLGYEHTWLRARVLRLPRKVAA